MLLVPGALIALIGAHLYLVVKLGTTAPPWTKAEKPRVAAPVSTLEAGAGMNGHSMNGHSNGVARTNGVRANGHNGGDH